ncbi:hypothetical protein GL213_01870 [Halogeometricum borinquense]|uniref:Uncharacterized protein n=1 Tax=Halogeometricum borinquense (strain ATCC 700274 / DSM 11551 / JCM 10706 / KCTC 4070 / PR3) TaxID=469382 RepID=E4NKT3_HALBP|nr:hypothetical protein [Halogeometricum borinquense]ADQ65979.1 hypothetical protein Hbor_03750 [Halogeometricum borinquense DSM 11551]ELY23135.1 hypothetical protein C499_19402 [Halogeometricum borinquense DSM 11551]QIQ75393.1 hypothetical protein GL213_01870 [Halogeometricum borinquense]
MAKIVYDDGTGVVEYEAPTIEYDKTRRAWVIRQGGDKPVSIYIPETQVFRVEKQGGR